MFFFARNFFRSEARSLCCQHGLHGGFSGGPACWQGRGAASARRPRLRAARALPLRRCTPPPAGAPTARPRRRCALQPQRAQTIARPTRIVLRAAWARGRKMPCGARASAARWRLRLRIGPQPRPQRPPSGSDGLGVRLAPFAAGCSKERPAWLDVCPTVRLPVAGDRADDGLFGFY